MREKFPDADVELKPAGGGRFEVAVNNTPVFEKSKLGRHARPGEILELVNTHLNPKQ